MKIPETGFFPPGPEFFPLVFANVHYLNFSRQFYIFQCDIIINISPDIPGTGFFSTTRAAGPSPAHFPDAPGIPEGHWGPESSAGGRRVGRPPGPRPGPNPRSWHTPTYWRGEENIGGTKCARKLKKIPELMIDMKQRKLGESYGGRQWKYIMTDDALR